MADTPSTGAATRVIVFQPALPRYRLDFFEKVAKRLGENFSVHFSPTDMGALTASAAAPAWSRRLGPIRRIFHGAIWQPGVVGIPLGRGDIVVVSGSPRNLSNMLMLAKARLTGARSIWWGQYRCGSRSRLRRWLKQALMNLSDAVLLYTDEEAAAWGKRAGKRSAPGTGLNNGVNVERIAALRRRHDAIERTLLFIGRLTAKAHLPLLIEALADRSLSNVTLVVIGDGDERSRLEALAQRMGVDDRIDWRGALVDEEQIASLANRARLFVYPGDVGLSLIHAMAYGLPVVVHDDHARHMPEIAAFQRAGSGLTFKRGDASSLATAIADALQSSQAASWSTASMQVVETAFNTNAMADRFCNIVAALTAAPERA